MDYDSEIQGAGKIDTAIPRQLVLDYLLHNCYGETARAFMKDDLDAVRDSDGRKSATSYGNNNSNGTPASSSSSSSLSTTHATNGSTPHRNGYLQGAVMTRNPSGDSASMLTMDRDDEPMARMDRDDELDQEGDSPMGESYLDAKDSLDTSTFTADKAHALHIDEQLKNLETRKAIRSLISHGDIERAMELCNSAFPGVLSIDPNSPLTTTASIHFNFKLQCQKFIEIVKQGPEQGANALMFAQQVIQDFTRLDPAGKDMYQSHMSDVLMVIAYVNPEESPNNHHLKQEARDHLADIMNSAVIGCNGMSCEPALLTIVKQATLVREYLAGDTSKTKRGLKSSRVFTIDSVYDKETGNYVIRWEDILQVCGTAKYVSSGGKLVPFMHENLKNLDPLRIAQQPEDVILDVVCKSRADTVKTSSSNANTADSTYYSGIDQIQATSHQISDLSITLHDPYNALVFSSNTVDHTPRAQASSLAHNQPYRFLDAVMAGQQTQVAEIKSAMGAHFDENRTFHVQLFKENRTLHAQLLDQQQKFHDLQQEMHDLQKRTLNYLTVIQSRLQAIFNQNYELHEYPIPRLFIALPKPKRRRDRVTGLLTHQFRLFFLCECGTHTMSDESTIKHEIHLAKHEGYDITRPTEFFQTYGPRVLKVLQWLQYGAAIAGVVAPGLAHLRLPDGFDKIQDILGLTSKNISPLIEQAIQLMEKQMKPLTSNLELTPEQAELEKLEVLEGADLRQLESFLKVTDQARSLGNLYRIVTYEGYVKWVCIDHYRDNYQESAAKQLHEFFESHSGEFSREGRRIKVQIFSKSDAKQFYEALVRAPRMQELEIKIGWDATLDDFRKLADAVSRANIVHLVIDDFPFDGPVRDAINSSRRFNPLVELMSNGRIQSMELRHLKNIESRISSSSFVKSSRLRVLAISSPISVTLLSLILQNCTSLAKLKIQMSSPRDAIQEVTRVASSLGNIESVLIINISASVEFSLHQGCITNIKLSDTGRQYLNFIDALPIDKFNSLELNNTIAQDLKFLEEILRASTSLESLWTPFADGTSISDIGLIKQIRVEGHFEGMPYKPLLLRFRNLDPEAQSEGFVVTVKPSGTSGTVDGISISIQLFFSFQYESRNYQVWEKIFQQYGSQIHEINSDFILSDECAALLDKATDRGGCNLINLHLSTSHLSSAGMDSMDRVIARILPRSLQRLGFTFGRINARQAMAARLLGKYGTLIHELSVSIFSFEECMSELQKLFSTKQDLPVLDTLSIAGTIFENSFSKSNVEWLCSIISVPTLPPAPTTLDPEVSTTVPEIRYDIRPLRSFSLHGIRMQTEEWITLLSSLDFSTLETLSLEGCNFEWVALERMVDSIPEDDDIEVPLRELNIPEAHLKIGSYSELEEVVQKLMRKAPLVDIKFDFK
ncbi:Ran-binding protein 9 [Dissophora globulifera]|nr:Ran-binding protein 9 [Dissophora globulifera]